MASTWTDVHSTGRPDTEFHTFRRQTPVRVPLIVGLVALLTIVLVGMLTGIVLGGLVGADTLSLESP